MGMREPLISIVIPVRNAASLIGKCLESLTKLDYPKDKIEVIIADGESIDNTRSIAESYGAKVINNPGLRVVAGRNIGFAESKGELIAFSDADCIMDSGWLRNCVKYFEDEKVAGVGGPNLIPDSESPFGKAVGFIFDYAYFFNAGAPTKKYDKVIKSRFHGSNAIYRASILRLVMPVDEGMYEGEDVIMNTGIKKLGYELLYVPDVIVWHHRRTTVKRWWSQMFIYGLGKVLMRRRLAKTVSFPQLILGLSLPIMLIFFSVFLLINPMLTLLYILGIVLLISLLLIIWAFFSTKSMPTSINLPLAAAILPIAWSCGFMRELILPKKIENTNKNIDFVEGQ
jgi:cellulose synthase/poly-beta-1,6-N-acetylglucosamine synthase-like glycosyltransferase